MGERPETKQARILAVIYAKLNARGNSLGFFSIRKQLIGLMAEESNNLLVVKAVSRPTVIFHTIP